MSVKTLAVVRQERQAALEWTSRDAAKNVLSQEDIETPPVQHDIVERFWTSRSYRPTGPLDDASHALITQYVETLVFDVVRGPWHERIDPHEYHRTFASLTRPIVHELLGRGHDPLVIKRIVMDELNAEDIDLSNHRARHLRAL